MGAYSVAETKAHLSEILKRVEAGEAATITKRGEVIAVIAPPSKSQKQIDWKALAAFRGKQAVSKQSAADLIREMRDASF